MIVCRMRGSQRFSHRLLLPLRLVQLAHLRVDRIVPLTLASFEV